MLRKIVYTLVGALVFGTIAWSLVVAQSTDIDSANMIAIIALIVGAIAGYWLSNKIKGGESPKTFAAFFIFLGVVHLTFLFINSDGEASLTPSLTLEGSISALIGIILIIIGLNIRTIINKYSSWILTLSYVSIAGLVISAIYFFATQNDMLLGILLWYALDVYILVHLIKSLKKLGNQS
ncbi:hypothetical protein IPM19_04730 [bacterium]|nr:MAG: hypothetical protein IPM19_04730 [bacterium]